MHDGAVSVDFETDERRLTVNIHKDDAVILAQMCRDASQVMHVEQNPEMYTNDDDEEDDLDYCDCGVHLGVDGHCANPDCPNH
jgi:hypothetical protein